MLVLFTVSRCGVVSHSSYSCDRNCITRAANFDWAPFAYEYLMLRAMLWADFDDSHPDPTIQGLLRNLVYLDDNISAEDFIIQCTNALAAVRASLLSAAVHLQLSSIHAVCGLAECAHCALDSSRLQCIG